MKIKVYGGRFYVKWDSTCHCHHHNFKDGNMNGFEVYGLFKHYYYLLENVWDDDGAEVIQPLEKMRP